MGTKQCVATNFKNITWDLIEKSLNNSNTPLEKRVQEEYQMLKKQAKDKSSNNLVSHLQNINSETQHIDLLISYIYPKKKLERFLKWYKMANYNINSTDISSSFIHTNTSGGNFQSNNLNNSIISSSNANKVKFHSPQKIKRSGRGSLKSPTSSNTLGNHFDLNMNKIKSESMTNKVHNNIFQGVETREFIFMEEEANMNMNFNMNSNNMNSSIKRIPSNNKERSLSVIEFDHLPAHLYHHNTITERSMKSTTNRNQNTLTSPSTLEFNITAATFEANFRHFYQKHTETFKERVAKSPPESFRWLSWLICSNVPEDRNEEIFHSFLSEELNENTDIQIRKDLNRTLTEFTQINFSLFDQTINFLDENPFLQIEGKISNNLDRYGSRFSDTQFNITQTQNFLYRVLRAFSSVDKEVSYCQGMNFIAGFLLIISDFHEIDTFYLMLSLFSSETFKSELGIRGFFCDGFPMLNCYLYIFDHYFDKKLHTLRTHFLKLEVDNTLWVLKWFQTLFTICLPIPIVCRVWDCIMSYGLEFIISFSLTILKHYETELLRIDDSFDIIDFFKTSFNGMKYTQNKLNKNSIPAKVNVEDLLQQARKFHRQHLTKINFNLIKAEYENKCNIHLKSLSIKYDLNCFLLKMESLSFTKQKSKNSTLINNDVFYQTINSKDSTFNEIGGFNFISKKSSHSNNLNNSSSQNNTGTIIILDNFEEKKELSFENITEVENDDEYNTYTCEESEEHSSHNIQYSINAHIMSTNKNLKK
jgi:hypothetical protein